MSESPLPQLFDADEIDRRIPFDPTVDEPPRAAPVSDPDPRHVLERQFPHVVERLVLLWNRRECGDYLRSLLVTEQGESRRGFPLALIEDLLMLDAVHGARFPPAGARGGSAVPPRRT
jgi:hypothetical protein